jgi:hypothetical protein
MNPAPASQHLPVTSSDKFQFVANLSGSHFQRQRQTEVWRTSLFTSTSNCDFLFDFAPRVCSEHLAFGLGGYFAAALNNIYMTSTTDSNNLSAPGSVLWNGTAQARSLVTTPA